MMQNNSKQFYWLWTRPEIDGRSWTIGEAHEDLAQQVGNTSIKDEKAGFVPSPPAKHRSEPAYYFGLDEEGAKRFDEIINENSPFHRFVIDRNEWSAVDDPTGPFVDDPTGPFGKHRQ